MKNAEKPRVRFWQRHLLVITVIVALLVALLSQTAFAQNSYVITDGANVTVHQSYSSDPDEVLQEVGITLSDEDTYTTTYQDGVNNITIQRMQMVTVNHHGNRISIGTYGESVSELLGQLDIELGENDIVSYQMESLTFDGMLIDIVQRETEVFEYDSIVPFETNYYEDPDLPEGEEIVLTEGVNGVVHYKMQVVRENGVEVSRTVLSQTVRVEAVNALIIRGAKAEDYVQPSGSECKVRSSDAPRYTISDNVITTSNGNNYTFTGTMQVSATAYSCDGRKGVCYSGTLARVGAIAVDPKVIPLGTKMYIVSNDGQYVYGYCVAEDIGGGIKGNRVDLYFDTEAECVRFGVRKCTVYFLTENS